MYPEGVFGKVWLPSFPTSTSIRCLLHPYASYGVFLVLSRDPAVVVLGAVVDVLGAVVDVLRWMCAGRFLKTPAGRFFKPRRGDPAAV